MTIDRRMRKAWRNLVEGAWDPADPSLWPSASQRLLLRAVVLEGEGAARAWREWVAGHDLESVSAGDRVLLPILSLKSEQLGVEPEMRAALRPHSMHVWARNQTALARLGEVLGVLKQAGVPAMALKGAPLLLFYYRDARARPMADVDVLIREADLFRAAKALEAAGWQSPHGMPPREVLGNIHATEWLHPSGFSLDLHWHPFTPDCPPTAEERLWKRSEVRSSRYGEMRIPAADDFIILMCFHGRKPEPGASCRWVVDVMKLIHRAEPAIDWNYVFEQCRDAGLLLPVRDALAFVAREFDAAVPDDFLRAAAAAPIRSGDLARYHAVVRGPRLKLGLAEVIAVQWWRYAAVRRARGERPRLLGFLRYYLARKQWEWNLEHKWQVPARAVQTAIGRVRSQGL